MTGYPFDPPPLPPSSGPDPDFIPAEVFTDPGTPAHALAVAYGEYAQRHGPGTQAAFLATEEGARLHAAAYPEEGQ